ncbi:MAG: hypothetical protein PVI57_05075 [Gemmatimonadota bacterium]|jgi:hypothetical protein
MSILSRPRGALVAVVLTSAVVSATCTTRSAGNRSSGAMGGMAPVLSVERFLQAANAKDFDAMARLFGTVDGPVEGDPHEIEFRMATIAEILAHEDYEIVSEERAPGRRYPTNRIGVNITKNGEVIRDVPFMVIQTDDGGWLIEEIDLEEITGR